MAGASIVEELLGPYVDTQSRWSQLDDGERFYDPQREALHEAWLAEALVGRSVSPDSQPVALVLAGGPASGKSTLADGLALPDGHTRIDPDWFKERIPEYAALCEAGEACAAGIAHEESSDLAKELLRRAMDARHPVVFDQVGGGEPGRFLGKLRELVACGYRVEVVYADVPTETAVERARLRGLATGRTVEEPIVRSLHAEVARRFGEVIAERSLASVQIYDCTADGEPELIAEWRAGEEDVRNIDRLDMFHAKGRS